MNAQIVSTPSFALFSTSLLIWFASSLTTPMLASWAACVLRRCGNEQDGHPYLRLGDKSISQGFLILTKSPTINFRFCLEVWTRYFRLFEILIASFRDCPSPSELSFLSHDNLLSLILIDFEIAL